MKVILLSLTLAFSTIFVQAQLNVFEIVSSGSSTSHIIDIATNFDLANTLQESENVTLFAPSDAAIEDYAASLGMELDPFLMSNEAYKLIQYHLLLGETFLFSELENDHTIITQLGTTMTVSADNAGEFANNTSMLVADFEATNGVVHLAQDVIVPSLTSNQWLSSSTTHNYFNIAMQNSGLSAEFEQLGTLTLFAPTDAAILAYIDANDLGIAELLYGEGMEDFVRMHWIENSLLQAMDLQQTPSILASSGETLFIAAGPNGEVHVNNAQVDNADILIHNAVIHSVDAVIEPNYFLSDALVDENLTLLTTLLEATGLLNSLASPGAMTLFAPTDTALLTFLTEQDLTLDDVLADTEGTTEGLLYHLTQGLFMASDLEDGMNIEMASGENLAVTFTETGIYVANGMVVDADIAADNGFLHIVDAVLLPPIQGCMDEYACNYDSEAAVDDGSCYSLDVTYEITNNVCVDGMDGTLEIQAIGIDSGLSFSLDALGGMAPIVNTTGSFEALVAGEYGVMVTDSLGCSTSWTVEITSPDGDPLVLNTNINGNDGSLEITGGSEPYSVTWYVSDTLEEVDPEDLVAGVYLVVVLDALGCKVSAEVNIEPLSSVINSERLSMTLFPNPAQDIIQIGNLDAGDKSIDVIHPSGRIALSLRSFNNSTLELNLGTFAPGVYLIKVQSAASTQLRRIILTD